MHLNPFAISNLLIVLTCFPMMIFVFSFGQAKFVKIYSLQILSVTIWGLGAFFASTTYKPEISLIWWKISYCGVIFIAVFFLHTIYRLISKYNWFLLIFGYIQGVLFLVLLTNGALINKTKFMFNSFYYVQGGPLFIASFIIWMLLVSIGHFMFFKFYFKNKAKEYIPILCASICGFGGGVTNFLPAFGFDIFPSGNFLIPIYIFLLTYAILKYQFLNINIVIQKGFIYSILIALITAIYFIFVFLAERFFQGMVGYTSLVVSLLCAFVISLFFTPVKNKIQHLADRMFLGKDPMQIAQENELLRQELLRSERLKAVATFASGMAHEIKNPLTAIKTFTEYLPQKVHDSEFIQKFSMIVNNEVQKIDNLVHQLLDFSKPSSLQLQKTNIHNLIDETLELLSSQLIKNNIKVKKEYCDFSLKISVDPQQIKQLFLNLFLNAIEAMPNGGTLFIRTNQQANYLTISIKDTGCGIPEKDIPHIFEPFYSLKEKGNGLGLSIVYNIIRQHKGDVRVNSKLKIGTLITLDLILL